MVFWKTSETPVLYHDALIFMRERIKKIRDYEEDEMIWFLEHPEIITAGSLASPNELIDSQRFPVTSTDRGGRYTYHGPGQRVVYIMLDLRKRKKDLHKFLEFIETSLIKALSDCGLHHTYASTQNRGIWLGNPERKIVAIGIKISGWISFHGIAVNISTNLEHFKSIIPCGIQDKDVTSLEKEGIKISYKTFDSILKKRMEESLKTL